MEVEEVQAGAKKTQADRVSGWWYRSIVSAFCWGSPGCCWRPLSCAMCQTQCVRWMHDMELVVCVDDLLL